jgi:hypothetical protein
VVLGCYRGLLLGDLDALESGGPCSLSARPTCLATAVRRRSASSVSSASTPEEAGGVDPSMVVAVGEIPVLGMRSSKACDVRSQGAHGGG